MAMTTVDQLTPEQQEEQLRKERSLVFFRGLMNSKHEGQKEIRTSFNTPEVQQALARLREKNAASNSLPD